MPDDAQLTEAGHLQLVQAVAHQSFGMLIAMPLVIKFQLLPQILVRHIGIGSLILTVGWRLRSKQRALTACIDFRVPKHRFHRGDGVAFGPNKNRRTPGERQRASCRGKHQELSDQRLF